MAPLIATACIVLMVAALSVYGPLARPRPPAHLRTGAELVAVAAADRQPGARRDRRCAPVAAAWARMALTAASVALLVGAIGTIGYPFYTNLYQDRVQSRLDRQIQSPELGRRTSTATSASATASPAS